MPYSDKERQYKSNQASRKAIYSCKLTIQIRKDSGIDEPLTKAASSAGITKAQYMIQATKAQLKRDGYMQEQVETTTE